MTQSAAESGQLHWQQQHIISGDALQAQAGRASPLKDGQEDLLTKMWLDDALTDLAAAGLDMPFL